MIIRLPGALAILVVACAPPRPVHRVFYTDVRIPGPFGEGTPADSALAEVDRDQDGTLTAWDLRPGSASAVVRVGGTHVDLPLTVPGYAPATTWHATLEPTGGTPQVHRFSMWLNCSPTTILSLDFELPPATATSPSSVTVLGFDAEVVSAQVRGAPGTSQVTGTLEVAVDDGRASGWLVGEASVPLATFDLPELPYEVPELTGQVFELHALAFRDIEVEP